MLDTVGPELQVVNKTEHPISLQEDSFVVLTPDQDKEATSNLLPINFHGLSKVNIFKQNIWVSCGTIYPKNHVHMHECKEK